MIINRVSRLLGERHENISDLQRATGLRYGTVWAIAQDKTRRIEFETLDALCKHFGVTPSEILEYVPDPQL